MPASAYGSLVGEYFFFSKEHFNGYALVGIGGGVTVFDNCIGEPDYDMSGFVMLQTGGRCDLQDVGMAGSGYGPSFQNGCARESRCRHHSPAFLGGVQIVATASICG